MSFDRRQGRPSRSASSTSAGPSAKFIAAAPQRATFGWVGCFSRMRRFTGDSIRRRRIVSRRAKRTFAALSHAASQDNTPLSPTMRIEWSCGATMEQVSRVTGPFSKYSTATDRSGAEGPWPPLSGIVSAEAATTVRTGPNHEISQVR